MALKSNQFNFNGNTQKHWDIIYQSQFNNRITS